MTYEDMSLHRERERLRDEFAARALQGMCSGTPWPGRGDGEEMAIRAYKFADAMLRERDKQEGRHA